MKTKSIRLFNAIGAVFLFGLIGISVYLILKPKLFHYIDARIGISLPLYGVQKQKFQNIEFLERTHCSDYRRECHCLIFLHGVGENANSWASLLKRGKKEWFFPVKLFSLYIPEATYLAIDGVSSSLSTIAQKYSHTPTENCTTKTLVGNSLGGMIASRMALDMPEKFDALMLINAAGIQDDYSYVQGILNSAKASDFENFFKRTYYQGPLLPQGFWYLVEKLVWLKRDKKLIFPNNVIPDLISEKEFSQLSLPTLILWGNEDRVLPDLAPKLQRSIASSEINYIEKCGHVPQKECPEAVLKGLKRIIKDIR